MCCFGGLVCDTLGLGSFHPATCFPLCHVGHLVAALEGPVARPPFPCGDLGRDVPGVDVPLLAAQAAGGGVWGMVLAALVRWFLGVLLVLSGIVLPTQFAPSGHRGLLVAQPLELQPGRIELYADPVDDHLRWRGERRALGFEP